MSETSTQITDRSAFEHGSLGVQIVLAIVTFGIIYPWYWMHKLHKQLAAGTDAEVSVWLRTIGLIIPIYNLVIIWRDSHDVEAITDKDGILIFLLFIVIPPVAWYLIQTGINDIAAE